MVEKTRERKEMKQYLVADRKKLYLINYFVIKPERKIRYALLIVLSHGEFRNF